MGVGEEKFAKLADCGSLGVEGPSEALARSTTRKHLRFHARCQGNVTDWRYVLDLLWAPITQTHVYVLFLKVRTETILCHPNITFTL